MERSVFTGSAACAGVAPSRPKHSSSAAQQVSSDRISFPPAAVNKGVTTAHIRPPLAAFPD
jgi:hypothetical protein